MGFTPQIIYEIIAPEHDFSRTETKGQGHIDPETVMTHSESPRSIYTPNLGFICGGPPEGGGGGGGGGGGRGGVCAPLIPENIALISKNP